MKLKLVQLKYPRKIVPMVDQPNSIGAGGIGLVGAHRTGKTTTAMVAAKQLGLKFVPIETSGVAKAMNHSFNDPCIIKQMGFQMRVLEHAMEEYDKAKTEFFITDRTPIDMLAYAYVNLNESNIKNSEVGSEMIDEMYSQYAKCCYDTLNCYFGNLFYVQPGIPIKPEEGKGHPSAAYMDHLSAIMGGLLIPVMPPIIVHAWPREVTGLVQRVSMIKQRLEMSLQLQHTTQEFQRLM